MPRFPWRLRRLAMALLALLLAPVARPAVEDRAEPLPRELEGVGVTERLDERIPLALKFTDEAGKPVQLTEFFHKGKPVILTLNYYTCPMLCGLQLNALLDVLKELKWTPGGEFEIVTVSIDGRDTAPLAALKKKNYIAELGRPEAARGWHFLTGEEADSKALADAVGFQYKWNPERKEYMHTSALMLLSPEGHVTRYLYGVQYDPKTLRLALLESGKGKIGTTIDRIVLYCYHYNSTEGRYSLVAMNIMRAGAALTAVALILGVSSLWAWDLRRRRILMRRDPVT